MYRFIIKGLTAALIGLVLAGCTTQKRAEIDPWSMIPASSTVLISLRSGSPIIGSFLPAELSGNKQITSLLERTEKIFIGLWEWRDEIPQISAVLLGNYPLFSINTALFFNKDWKQTKSKTTQWESSLYRLTLPDSSHIKIDETGKTDSENNLKNNGALPGKLAELAVSSDFFVYIPQPNRDSVSTLAFASIKLKVETAWFAAVRNGENYLLNGTFLFGSDRAAAAFVPAFKVYMAGRIKKSGKNDFEALIKNPQNISARNSEVVVSDIMISKDALLFFWKDIIIKGEDGKQE